MRFVSEDNGNCRVYYRESNRLFCWQDESSWGRTADWKFYVCSHDGEPSHEVPEPVTPPCPGETATGRSLNAFLQTRGGANV